MWQITLVTTGEVIADNFLTLGDANSWHDNWADDFNDDNLPNVIFSRM